ncbi:MAG: cysteine--tRNA ligase, partial [Patescibacteria group bacterium]
MKIYNTLTRQVEEFVPLKKGKVGLYTCGPTVYDYSHIGHGWKYVNDDLLKRLLTYNGYQVTHVQNITDVGHLVSDADEGEDKLESGAAKTGKSVWETAEMFIKGFYETMDKLNILRPDVVCRATEHIPEQIELIKRLVDKGFAYDTPEAVYFDVSKFPRYGELSGQRLADKLVAARQDVQTGSHKKSPVDFALWFKLIGRFEKHVMKWDSPWGVGFPGWHIECSAMSMKYLGESFDIHTGGEDHIPVHHTNEIAQSEAATGKPFVRYWMHSAFLMVDGQKMSKSLGNMYRVEDVAEKGFDPMALRYLYLTAHYRTPLSFTWSSLAAAQSAYDKLCQFVQGSRLTPSRFASKVQGSRRELSKEKLKKIDQFRVRFLEAVNNDLNFPQGLAMVWGMVKSNIPDYDKLEMLLDWDQILGLGLANVQKGIKVPEEIAKLAGERESLRKAGKFVEADKVRMQIEALGFTIKDTAMGPAINVKR